MVPLPVLTGLGPTYAGETVGVEDLRQPEPGVRVVPAVGTVVVLEEAGGDVLGTQERPRPATVTTPLVEPDGRGRPRRRMTAAAGPGRRRTLRPPRTEEGPQVVVSVSAAPVARLFPEGPTAASHTGAQRHRTRSPTKILQVGTEDE